MPSEDPSGVVEHEQPTRVLVVLAGTPDAPGERVVQALVPLVPTERVVQTGPGAATVEGRLVLRAGHGRSRWQQVAFKAAEHTTPAAARAALAVRFDRRLRPALREADLVIALGPGADAVGEVTRQLAPAARVVTGHDAACQVGERLALQLLPQGHPRPRTALPQEELDLLTHAVWVLADQDPSAEVRERARLLPWLTLDRDQRAHLVGALGPLLGADDVVVRGWSLLLTDSSHRATPDKTAQAAADLLAAADTLLDTPSTGTRTDDEGVGAGADAGDSDHGDGRDSRDLTAVDTVTAARWAALALRLWQAGDEESGPALDLLRRSRTGLVLTGPVPSPPTAQPVTEPTAVGAGGETPRAAATVDDAAAAPTAADGSHHRVLLLPAGGSGPALRTALRVSPVVDVLALSGPDVPSSLRGPTVPDQLVEARLRAGLGLPVHAYRTLVATLRERRPDVVVVDGADQRAVLASLTLPAQARLVVLLRPEDLDGPWLPLVDLARVDRLLVPDESSRERVLGQVSGPPERVEVLTGLAELRHPDPADEAASLLREVVLGDIGRLSDHTAAGEHDAAMRLVTDLLARPAHEVGAAALQQGALATTKAGEPTARLELLRRWAELDDRPLVAALVREQEGRLREFGPGWLPGDLPATGIDPVPGRVLHLLKASLPHRTSGYAVRSFYLLRERSRAGEDVLAATALDFPGEPAPPVEDVGGVPHLRLLRDDIPEREPPDTHLDAFARRLLEVVREHRPAVLHAHSGHRGYELALVALAVGRATGIPVVYEVRGLFEGVWTSEVERATRSELYRLRRELETRCLARADAVVTLSESMREDIVGRRPTREGLRADPERVVVVPNGVDAAAIDSRPPRQDLRERLGLAEAHVVGYVSNLDHPREGQEVLVEAVALLRRRGVAVSALLVGGGQRQQALERLAVERGVAEHVVLTGQVPHEEVGDYYALLDIFVVPRIDERAARLVTPLKPYEAMSMGVPVVVSALPALLEIVGEGERGATFPAGDAAALADVLEELLADPARRASMAQAARAWVREHRTWAAIARRYDRVYEIAASRAGSRSAGRVGEPLHGGDEGR